MKNLFLITVLILAIFSSCLKEDTDTLVIPNARYALPIDQVIPVNLVDEIKEFMPIYDGDTPPEIGGVYLIKPNVLVVSSFEDYPEGTPNTADLIKFSDQNRKTNIVTYERKQDNINSDEYEISKFVSVVGSSDKFTAYFNTNGSTDSGITYKTATVISGTFTKNGISDYHKAFIMLEKSADPENELFPEKEYRVFRDNDKLAENSEW